MCCTVGKCDKSDRKFKKQLFLWCSYNYAEGTILVCYEKKKNIRSIVIKIHKLKIPGGL